MKTLAAISAILIAGPFVFAVGAVAAENSAMPEIVIGNVVAVSSNDDAATSIRVSTAYFGAVNAAGGIKGRRIRFVSYDAKGDLRQTLHFTRRLVEVDNATLLYQMDPAARSIGPYVRYKRIPRLFDAPPSAAGIPPLLQGKVLGEAIKELMPKATIAVLYREEQFGNEALTGLYAGLGPENARLKIKNRAEVTDTVNSVARLAGEKSDVLVVLGDLELQRQVLTQFSNVLWFPVAFMTDAALALEEAEMEGPPGEVVSIETRIRDVSEEEQAAWKDFRTQNLPAEVANKRAAFAGFLQARALVDLLGMCVEDDRPGCLADRYGRSGSRRIAQPVLFEQGAWKPVGQQGPPLD